MSDEFKRYARKLQRLCGEALPLAVAEAINQVATFAHVAQAKNLRDRFTLRNQYTERSLRFYKASPKAKISKINAVTGSVAPYMDLQDSGGRRRPKRGRYVAMPMPKARMGSNLAKVVMRKYKAGTLTRDMFVGTPKGVHKGSKRGRGVWLRHNRNKRLSMLRDLGQASVPIKPTRWHRDAVSRYARQDVIEREFIKQAERALSGITE